MNSGGAFRRRSRRQWIPVALLGLATLLGLSLAITIGTLRQHHEDVAVEGARNIFRLIVVTRRWNADHGGVYVPITEATLPNPYLDHPERDVVTTQGRHLTLVSPAHMTRQLADLAALSGSLHIHITSLKPIRPGNLPDDWEAGALERFERGEREFHQLVEPSGRLRYMAPLMVSKSCLGCHGVERYRSGEVRGGISVSLDYAPIAQALNEQIRRLALIHLALFVAVGAALVLLLESLARRWAALELTSTALAQNRQRLVLSEKMASLGGLAAGIASEIDRPLVRSVKAHADLESAIAGMTALLQDKNLAADALPPALDRIREQQQRAFSHLRRSAELSARFKRTATDQSSAEPRRFALGETLRDMLASLWHTLKSRPIEVQLSCPPDLVVFGNPGQYALLLTRLILYRLDEGFADPARRGHLLIEAATSADGRRLTLRLSDDGAGIPPDRLGGLFAPPIGPVGRDDRGLGLHLVHLIVTGELGGTLNCESDTDKGTHFFIDCPLPSPAQQGGEDMPVS